MPKHFFHTLFISFAITANHTSFANTNRPAVEVPSVSIEMECMTPEPTTTFIVDTQNETVTVQLVSHYGTKHLPIHSGLVTSSDLPQITKQAELLSKLGSSVTFKWPVSACKQVEHKRFHCFGQGEVKTVNGVEMKGFSIDTGWSDYQNVGGVYRRYNVTLSVIIEKELYSVMMDYTPESCKLSLH